MVTFQHIGWGALLFGFFAAGIAGHYYGSMEALWAGLSFGGIAGLFMYGYAQR